MTVVIIKSAALGFMSGGALSLIFSLLTASANGRNVMTGEAMELRGYKAVYIYINENGLANYFVSLVPSFLIFSAVAILILGVVFQMRAKNA